MDNDEFNAGRNNQSYGGGNWDDYTRGQNERRWNDQVRADIDKQFEPKPSSFPPNNPQQTGGGGGGGYGGDGEGCGQIIAIGLGIVVGVPTAVSSLFSSILIWIGAKLLKPSFSEASFWEACKSSFLTTVIYLVVAIALALLQAYLYPNLTGIHEEVSLVSLVKYFFFFAGTSIDWLTLLEFHVICILLSALMLRYMLNEYLEAFKGYAIAVLTTTITIFPSMVFTCYLAFELMKHQVL